MEYNISFGSMKKPNTQFINNNNYLTFLLGDNLKSIKINYNIKGQESINKTLLSNNRYILNKTPKNNFKNFMNKFDKLKPKTTSKIINFKLGKTNDNPIKNIYKNELRITKDSFFRSKDISNIAKKVEKHLNNNKSTTNIKSSDLNIFNKYFRINKNQNNNIINYSIKNINCENKYPINNKFIKNYNKNLNQFINYENNSKNIKNKNSQDINQPYSRNHQKLLFSSLNPVYIASRRKIGSESKNNNFYIKKNYLKLKNNSINSERSNISKEKKILQLKSPQNKKEVLKKYKTPIYKIRKNILKTNDLSLTKKIKLSSVSTREPNSKYNKANSEMSLTYNEKEIKDINKDNTEAKEIKNIIKGYNAVTQAGTDKNFFRKINQDFYVIETNINGIKNFNIFAVLDGHGLYGHLISLFVGKYIVNSFINHDEIKFCLDTEELYFRLKHNNYALINEIFVNAEKKLKNEEFDSNFSGTTCIIVIQLGQNIICANSGDSRAILIYNEKEIIENKLSNINKNIKESDSNFYQIKNIIAPFSTYRNNLKNSLKASSSLSNLDIKKFYKLNQRTSLNKKSLINPDNNLPATNIFNLSNDLKPTLPLEKKRILEKGGRVEKYIEEDGTSNGPYRVWVKNEMYPGLAMSRSIGDFIASSVGVIPNPEIIEYTINKSSKYMIIASDGIWQFMSNEKVMNIANQYYPKKDPIDLCNDLIREANTIWDKEGLPRDDITVLVVYF